MEGDQDERLFVDENEEEEEEGLFVFSFIHSCLFIHVCLYFFLN